MTEPEESSIQSVALQNAATILKARQKTEQELLAAKEELRSSNETLRAIFDQAAVGIALAELDGRFAEVNSRFVDMLAYPREELMRLTYGDITHPEDRAATRASFERLLAGQLHEDVVEKRCICRDGSVVWTRTSVTLLRDSAGKPRRFIGVVQDITRQKETAESLRRSDEFNRTIVESTRDCLQTLSLEGALLWSSAQGRETFCGGAEGDGLGKPWVELWHGTDRDEAAEAVRAAARGESGSFVGQFAVDGRPRWWDVLVTPIRDARGRPESLLAVSRDITERVASEQERKLLLESERAARSSAERASQMKDDFLATLSHELRTPLGAILGWSQLLRRASLPPEEMRKGLETIERNARVQTQLIDDLLDMSRITSGKLRLDIQNVEPIAFIEAAVETVRPSADAKGIRLEKMLDPMTGPVAGDPHRLQQVVWNLLSNAIKFTPKGGKVQVMLARVNSHIEVSVADTGEGIEPAFIPHIFERFRQADASTTRRFGGLGLGLSIVKHLIELHGGRVRAASAGLGKGTTFTVEFPLPVVYREPSSESRAHPRGMSAALVDFVTLDLDGLRVLVVDDEADGRDLVKRVLSECRAEVLTAGSASEALALIEKGWPEVLVSDIGMPGIDGFELIRRVREMESATARRMPAIALTAFARSEDRTRALRAGYLVHVSKPVEPSELVATVASVAGRIEGR